MDRLIELGGYAMRFISLNWRVRALLTVICVACVSCNRNSDLDGESAAAGMQRFKYQCWDGGPHIVIPQSLADSWHGVQLGSDILDPSTDYGRACAITEDFQLIPVANGKAIVLAGSPPMVAWSPRSSTKQIDLFILNAWQKMDLDALLDTALQEANFKSTGETWEFPDTLLRLHYAGDDLDQPAAGRIDIPCEPGEYEIHSSSFQNADLGEVILIRLVKVTK